MKKAKKILALLLVGVMIIALGSAAFAADELSYNKVKAAGFYKTGEVPSDMTVTIKNATGEVTKMPANVDGTEGFEWFYPTSERLEVTLTGVTEGTQIVAMLTTSTTALPTQDSQILYINQYTVGNTGTVTMNILPLLPTTADSHTPMTLYITGNNDFVMKTFSIGYATEPTTSYDCLRRGDITGDGSVDVSDALKALRCGAKLETLTEFQLYVGKVSNDDSVDVSDALIMLRYGAKLITVI